MPLECFLQSIVDNQLVMLNYTKWSENANRVIRNCSINSESIHSFDGLSFNPRNCYVQSWSSNKWNDKMWYHYTENGKRRYVKLSSTIGKLENAIHNYLPSGHYKFILSEVSYSVPNEKLYNARIKKLIDEYRTRIAQQECFNTAVLLTNSKEFEKEREICLIAHYFGGSDPLSYISYGIESTDFITKVEFDPWIGIENNGMLESLCKILKSYLPSKKLKIGKLYHQHPPKNTYNFVY